MPGGAGRGGGVKEVDISKEDFHGGSSSHMCPYTNIHIIFSGKVGYVHYLTYGPTAVLTSPSPFPVWVYLHPHL